MLVGVLARNLGDGEERLVVEEAGIAHRLAHVELAHQAAVTLSARGEGEQGRQRSKRKRGEHREAGDENRDLKHELLCEFMSIKDQVEV